MVINMRNVLELKRTNKDNIIPESNVFFNEASPYSEGITYDPVTGIITLSEPGQYSVKWWVATETSLTGCIQFALKSSQGDELKGCSPTKRGQVVGFGDIYTSSPNVTLWLENSGTCQVITSQTSPVTAALLVQKIPEDGIIPTFEIDKVETLEPGENAVVDLQEDTVNPDNWLFSFGIPKGETGDSPHIDADTGNWFVGERDTGVKARGPSAAIIPFSISKYGMYFSYDTQGEPMMVAFSGFGSSYYDSSTYLQEGEWATGTITIREDMNVGTSFILPNDGILKKIKVLFATGDYNEVFQNTTRPFVCLAVSDSNSFEYRILQETLTFTTPYEGGVDYPKNTIRKGASDNLNVEIAEGSLVAIISGIMSDNPSGEQQLRFTVSGGIYID